MSSPSTHGLVPIQRLQARRIAVHAAYLGVYNAAAFRYFPTVSGDRWMGINQRIDPRDPHNHFPTLADCSSFVTWCLWAALYLNFGIRDVVNGQHWKAGYTGTLAQHGWEVTDHSKRQWADLALYGDPTGPTGHVAICVGGGKVISHGSDAAPFKLDLGYRTDLYQIRRYF